MNETLVFFLCVFLSILCGKSFSDAIGKLPSFEAGPI